MDGLVETVLVFSAAFRELCSASHGKSLFFIVNSEDPKTSSSLWEVEGPVEETAVDVADHPDSMDVLAAEDDDELACESMAF